MKAAAAPQSPPQNSFDGAWCCTHTLLVCHLPINTPESPSLHRNDQRCLPNAYPQLFQCRKAQRQPTMPAEADALPPVATSQEPRWQLLFYSIAI